MIRSDIAKYFSRMGKKGGKATGPTKRRSPEHYAYIQQLARAAKKRKKKV